MMHDVRINERPKFLTFPPTLEDQTIECNDLVINLSLRGIPSFFPFRKPTTSELNEANRRLEFTAPYLEWNPRSEVFAKEEDRLLHCNDHTRSQHTYNTQSIFVAATAISLIDIVMRMIQSAHVSMPVSQDVKQWKWYQRNIY
jgi:hypothetical protein